MVFNQIDIIIIFFSFNKIRFKSNRSAPPMGQVAYDIR